MTFGGPADHTTFYIASNSFWSANQVVDARPNFGERPGGAESYTQVRIGDVQLSIPALATAGYAAAQDLARATINATYTGETCTVSHESIVANPENVLITRFTVSGTGCGNASFQLLSGSSPGRYGPTRAGVSPSGVPWIARDSVSTRYNTITAANCFIAGQHNESQLWLVGSDGGLTSLDGRCLNNVTVENGTKITIGPCDNAEAKAWRAVKKGPALPGPPPGPSPEPSFPGFESLPGYVGGQPETSDFHCKSNDPNACRLEAAQACNESTTCASFAVYLLRATPYVQFYDAEKTAKSYPDVGWNLWKKVGTPGPPQNNTNVPGLVLQNSVTGGCAGLDLNGEFVVTTNCSYATRWALDVDTHHLSLAGTNVSWGVGKCLTLVEPNPLVVAAAALRVIGSDGASVPLAPTSDGVKTATFELNLDQMGGSFTLVTAVVTAGDCTGCDPNHESPEVSAMTLANMTAEEMAGLEQNHAGWWRQYWSSGAMVDLGPQWELIESFYYGAHYQIGSASRADRFAPGLWGPWLTSDTCGWSGDYTLNYNFEANFYGVFSDGRPELAQPYFQTILNHVDLGRWRASMKRWGSGVSAATPGFWAQDFNHMDQLSSDGTGFVDAGYDGIQFPTHLSPWKHFYFVSDWGQKNVGSFTAKAFQDYYEYTGNVTFLREIVYPLMKLNAEFYASYMTKLNGRYSVMHSCAMEGCGAQGPLTSTNIAVSNNPPFDLAFVRRTFRSLLTYSALLGVDESERAGWQDILDNVADYPLTQTETGDTVFAQATLNPGPTSTATDGFPNASKCQWNCGSSCSGIAHDTSECGNARYPITFFNAMHPGEDIDLASTVELLDVARRTTSVVNAINDYSPTNGLCMAWPASARVVENATDLLNAFTQALNDTMMPNFIPFIDNRPTGGSGCNVENSGATVAINDLMASVHGHGSTQRLVIFPGGCPDGASWHFQGVRVRGAFEVSSTGTGSNPVRFGPTTVTSLAGNNLTFAWATPPTVTTSSGEHITVSPGFDVGIWVIPTTASETYNIE